MAARRVDGRVEGYYRSLLVDNVGDEDRDVVNFVVGDEELEEGVYKVERAVEMRKRNVSAHYMMMLLALK